MNRLTQSVRWRLSLWYAVTLAAVLGASAVLSLLVVRRVLEERTDHFLEESRRGFLSVLSTEEREYSDSFEAVQAAVAEIGFIDTRLFVWDSIGYLVGVSEARGLGSTPAGEQLRNSVYSAIEHAQQVYTPTPKPLAEAIRSDAPLLTVAGDNALRVAFGKILLHNRPYTVAAARSRVELLETLERVRRAYLVGIPLVLIVAAGGGYLLARRALAPVASMAKRARAISATTLHERLPLANPKDEFGELGSVVNDLLARLEDAFAQQRRFVADASHELRTPVAVMLAESEVTLERTTRPEIEYRDSLRVIRDATLRLSRIVDDLFLLARSDSGNWQHRRDILYLDELADDCTRSMRAVAATRDVAVQLALTLPATDGALVRGDPELLGRLLLNLVDNAIKHSLPGGTVIVSVRDSGDRWSLSVSDQGAGVPLELQDKIFERFVRGDTARTTSTLLNGAPENGDTQVFPRSSGAGLGLAIARWVAEFHGGSLKLTRTDQSGSEFTAFIPKAQPTAEPVVSSTLSLH